MKHWAPESNPSSTVAPTFHSGSWVVTVVVERDEDDDLEDCGSDKVVEGLDVDVKVLVVVGSAVVRD